MNDIYSCKSNEFSHEAIIDRLNDISGEIEEEQEKPDDEYDRDKVFKLMYRQFIEGLKLSTGYRI